MSGFLLAYDEDCGPCTKFKRAIEFLDSYGKLRFMSLNAADEDGVLDPLSRYLRHRSFHLIPSSGAILSGAEALPTLVSLLPAGKVFSRLMLSAPGGPRAADWIYSMLSKLHDTCFCS